jgi:fibronectin type 3 domain-containing protein
VLVFTDKTVQDGQTYSYEVTSVDSGGLESAVDGPVQVAIPSS